MVEFLLVDGSYYSFYRYFALLNWWKHSHPDEELPDPSQNEDFVTRFRAVFIKKIKEFIKKLKMNDPVIIVGLDCPRTDIWRNELFDSYKANRVYDDKFMGGSIFKMVHKEELFRQAGANMTIRHPHLEADDCLALTTKNILGLIPHAKITIITSDMDYLQLACENIRLVNLKYKDLTDSKNCFKNKEKDLFCKIVMGDKSDAIPSIFKKCGIKTAAKCYEDKEYFHNRLKQEDAYERYELNKKLVDFRKIPQKLVDEFNSGKYTTNYT